MKAILIFALGIITLVACKTKSSATDKEDPSQKTNNDAQATLVHEKLIGSFVGSFGDNKITMLIDQAQNDSVSGRTIVGGNDRPFSGTVAVSGGKYTINVSEPGDDKNDGKFSISFDVANSEVVQGTWVPFKEPAKTKEFVLQRKAYKYDINVGDYPQASQRLLTEQEVENRIKSELEYMRNEIFARHGYCFKKKDLRQIFEKEAWYVPNTVSVVDRLTSIEKKNIELIKRYEKYAEQYGDEFGR
jgi:hypothetical protein